MGAMDNLPRLTVSIVLYNSPLGLLQRALDSLCRAVARARQGGALGGVQVEVIDHSPDADYRQTVSGLLRRHQGLPNLALTYHDCGDKNRGFGAGNNRALALARGEFFLVLNPDVEMAEDAPLCGLQRLAAEPAVVLLSPRADAASGDQEFLCKRYPSVLVLMLRGFAPPFLRRSFRRRLERYEMRDRCAGTETCEVMLATGCFMLVRTRALRDVAGFDEAYFLYFEDYDLSLRLAERGRLLYEPQMRIVHHGGHAARKGGRHIWLFLRSARRFFSTHGWHWI